MFSIALIGGLFALIFWGLNDYVAGKSGQERDEYLTTLIIHIITPVLLLPLIFYYGESITLGMPFLIVMIVTLFFTIASVSFVKALSMGPFGVVSPLGNSYALITLIIGIVFLQLQISVMQFSSLLIIIIGVIILSVEKKAFNHKKLQRAALFFAMITMFFRGIGFVFIDMVIDIYPWYQLLFLISSFMCFFTFSCYVIIHKSFPKWEAIKYKNMTYAWKGGLFVAIGSAAFYIGAGTGGSVIVPAVIASASPLVTSFMAHVKEKEKISLYKRIGAVIIVFGLILLNLS